jgi:hypothetical protein
MATRTAVGRREEAGIALLVTVFVLLLMGAIAITAIGHSGQEATASATGRVKKRTFHGADAGIQVALRRLAEEPPNQVPFDIDLGGGRTVQSRSRSDATPQPIPRLGVGPPPEGFSINVGSGYINEIFLTNVTASSPNATTVELEAKLGRLSANSGG